MFGVQTERLRNLRFSNPLVCDWLYFARVSSETALKILYTSESSKEAAIPIGSGNTVTLSLLARPCSASLHQLNFFIPNRGIAGDWSCISKTFSLKVNRAIKSFALSSELRLGFL